MYYEFMITQLYKYLPWLLYLQKKPSQINIIAFAL